MFTFFLSGLSVRGEERVAASELSLLPRVLPSCENSVGRALGKRENTIDGSVIFRAIEHVAQAAVGTEGVREYRG